MSVCSRDILVGPYKDGQLPPERVAEMEAHLGVCQECAGQLADLREISRRIGEVELRPILPIEQLGLHRAIDRLQVQGAERMVLRIATSLGAVAACVLVVTSLGLATNLFGGSKAGATTSASSQLSNGVNFTGSSNGNASPAPQGGGAGSGDDLTNANLSGWMVRSLGGESR